MRAPPAEDAVRVSTLELFFDLVFVFTITQLTSVLAHDTSLRGLAQVVLMLTVIWWMYGGYVWLTNAVAPDRAERRVVLLGGMAAFLVVALAVPHAFGEGGPAFGIAYLAVVGVHLGMFAKGTSARTLRAVVELGRYNLVTALLVLAGGLAGGTAQYVLWALAGGLEWVTPRLIGGAAGFAVAPGHFVERHGLVILIAIAAAEKTVVAHPLDGLDAAPAIALGGGVAVFLAGDALFRRSLAIGPGGRRAAAAVLALVTIPLALAAAVLQLVALVGVLAALFAAEAPRRQTVPA